MSLNIKTVAKPKAKPLKTKAKPAAPVGETALLVDKIVEQNPAILAAKEPKKLQEQARKELLELVQPSHEPTDEIVVKGTKGQVRFSPCSTKRSCVDPQKVHQMLGDEAFYAIITVSLTELDKYLTPHQVAQVVVPECGSRGMTVLPLDS